MNVLVTGAGGQLGRCLAQKAATGRMPAGWTLTSLNQHQLDITDGQAVNAAFRRIRPAAVFNTAAWTDVDGAERSPDRAMAVNALGAANVAAGAAAYGVRLFHLSTDYVFDGALKHPIDEAAQPRALNVYGASKLAGELAVRREAPDAVIVRTSWLYSHYGRNFPKAILRRAAKVRVLDVVDDQLGCPTSATDLADALVHLAQQPALPAGIYHYCGKDAMTWFDFARLIVDCATWYDATWADVRLRRRATGQRDGGARRPAYSVLSCEKIKATGVGVYGPGDHLETLVASVLAMP